MSERRDSQPPREAVEAMLLAAAGYVRASDDLRPRLLEAARAQCTYATIRGVVGMLAISASLVVFMGSGGRRAEAPSSDEPTLAQTDSQTIYSQAQAKALRSGGLSWGIVDAFRELRQKQSEAIGSDL
jgi:hypothetical protein